MSKMVRGLSKSEHAALLIIECQRGVLEPGLAPFAGLVEQVGSRGIVPRIAMLAQTFRACGKPVIHLHVAHRPDYSDLPVTSMITGLSVKHGRMRVGTVEVEPVPELVPQKGDIVHARTFSLVAFNGTDLNAMLHNMGVQTIVLAGVSTNVAVSGCAVCGSDLGFQVVVAEDCIAAASAEMHTMMVQQLLPLYATVSSSQEIQEALA